MSVSDQIRTASKVKSPWAADCVDDVVGGYSGAYRKSVVGGTVVHRRRENIMDHATDCRNKSRMNLLKL